MSGSNRVLIVDDSPINLKALACLVNSLGFEIDIASDGEQAIRETRCHDYALVLMDLRLPHQDGFVTAKTIRADRNDVPIIAVSAYPLSSDWSQCLEAGIDDFLCKGFNREELKDIVKKWAGSNSRCPVVGTSRHHLPAMPV
jgi:two-component system, sensor histidine kinase